jgi:hypothetical protein
LGVPAKIAMLDYRVQNHHVSAETEVALQDYLSSNSLDKVKVRVNQYDPAGEWARLCRNRSVCWPVRYTIGTLSVVGYTLLPGRILGCDHYNPYTNTINVYSDVPSLGLYSAGHAKEFAYQDHKTLYALADSLPAFNIGPETRAAKDALEYLATQAPPDELRAGYRAIGPAYALHCSQPLQAVTGLPLVLPSLVAGHAVGQIKAAQVHEEQAPRSPQASGATDLGTPLPPPDERRLSPPAGSGSIGPRGHGANE